MNLARMGAIRSNEPDYNPFEEGQARRRGMQLERQAMLDLAKGKLDLAKAKRAEEAALSLAKEQAREREIMGRYVQGRDAAQTLPLGVVNPRFLEGTGAGPQQMEPKRTVAPVERETMLDLARVNPATAESFRMGRQAETQGAEDRQRKIEQGMADQARKDAELAERERHNRMVEELRRRGIIKRGSGASGGTSTATTTATTGGGKTTPRKPIDPIQLAKLKASKQGAITDLDAAASVVDRLIGNEYEGIEPHPGLYGLTGISGAIPFDLPGGNTKDAEALRQQLVAKSAFAELQKMRANSPTGGALGAVSDKENQMLQNAAAALQRGQSPDQFRKNLEEYRALLRQAKRRIQEAYAQDFGEELPNLNGDDFDRYEVIE